MSNIDPLSWNELPDMMTVQELRRFLGIGDRQARRWAKENNIYLKIGGSARIPKQGVSKKLSEKGDINLSTADQEISRDNVREIEEWIDSK